MNTQHNIFNQTQNFSSSMDAMGDGYRRVRDIHTLQYTSSHSQDDTVTTSVYEEYNSTIEKKVVQSAVKNISVFDVARAILQILNKPISTMKLHKLLYYCQAWSLVWDEKPLFTEKIEAWANGPVVRELFNFHKGMFELSINTFPLGNVERLDNNQIETINAVLDFYGDKSAQWLIDQTHFESPWIMARKGLNSDERGFVEISLDSMIEYYSALR